MEQETGLLLIAEDDETVRLMLRRYFEARGFDAVDVPDGSQALRALAQRRFDVVILDAVMPGLGGLEVLQAVRRTHTPTDLPVIMATARGDSIDVVGALRLGANDYLVKPFDFAVALARVQTQLSLKRSVDRIAGLERSLAGRNAELAEANRRMREDLEAAARVQQTLLPARPLGVPGVRLAWHFRPCDELAGDLLNAVALGPRHIALYVLDVSGHGVKAALMALMVSGVLAQLLVPRPGRQGPRGRGAHPLSPARVAAALDRAFPWDDRMGQFCTLLYGVLDRRAGRFDFVSAGHPGPVHLPQGGRARVVQAVGAPIGLGGRAYATSTVPLGPGDRLYLYSDGLTDAKGGGGERFGKGRLLEAVEQGRALPLQEGVTSLADRVGLWCGPGAPGDDVSLLAVEFTGPAAALAPRRARREDSSLSPPSAPLLPS
jgi:phosphoserine phosphatase RsbU/P